jgi:RNAse (barnase) inhibitor barstar
VEVSEPGRESGNVDTWKLKVVTRPGQPGLPRQRIHIDICAVPSYDRQPMVLRNHYGVDMGTAGLIIQAQSREEILADKMVALALRANRIKNRDLWDIGWLKQQNTALPVDLVWKKVADRSHGTAEFTGLLSERVNELLKDTLLRRNFVQEMKRFLPPEVVADTVEKDEFWTYLVGLVRDEASLITAGGKGSGNAFKM